ncbi:MAG TPA: ABC transporter ATP-binding protein [Terriglobales bacterium]|nr:ABC transporter ATP-binding protein [Terriglobales bacterium]
MHSERVTNPNGSGAALLEVSGLTRTFGSGSRAVAAVDHVSFSIQAGEIVALVGQSGSGKSTLARLLLRLLDATQGTFSLAGRDVTHLRGAGLKAYWRDVQAVFQDPFSSFNQFFPTKRLLYGALTILEHQPRGAERDGRVVEAIERVGLGADLLDKWPHQLSGGQRQRMMLARALLVGPRLLIADEPTSMLDASLRVTILNLLRALRDDLGMTVLFITHDLGQAGYLSDRVLVMSRGQLVESGPTDDVLWHPQHDYTRGLLADVPRLHSNPPHEIGTPGYPQRSEESGAPRFRGGPGNGTAPAESAGA